MTTYPFKVRGFSMWDTLLGLIPEKRQPGAVSVLAFFSITLPILAAVCALAAWKLNDRLNRHRLPLEATRSSPGPAAPSLDPQLTKALHATQDTLRDTQMALHDTQAELEKEKEHVLAVVAATKRHITTSQRQRFIKFNEKRPKGRVNVSAIEGDEECREYAEEIRSLLITAGYDVGDDVGNIQLHDESLVGLRVGVFSKETAPPYALSLSACFIDSDIFAPAVINLKVAIGQVEVFVGTNPASINDDLPPEDPTPPDAPPATAPEKKVVAP